MNGLARDPKQLGNLIQRARKAKGLTQSDLGTKAGLRQETVSLIENGASSAKIDTVLSVLSALDLELRIAPRTSSEMP